MQSTPTLNKIEIALIFCFFMIQIQKDKIYLSCSLNIGAIIQFWLTIVEKTLRY